MSTWGRRNDLPLPEPSLFPIRARLPSLLSLQALRLLGPKRSQLFKSLVHFAGLFGLVLDSGDGPFQDFGVLHDSGANGVVHFAEAGVEGLQFVALAQVSHVRRKLVVANPGKGGSDVVKRSRDLVGHPDAAGGYRDHQEDAKAKNPPDRKSTR